VERWSPVRTWTVAAAPRVARRRARPRPTARRARTRSRAKPERREPVRAWASSVQPQVASAIDASPVVRDGRVCRRRFAAASFDPRRTLAIRRRAVTRSVAISRVPRRAMAPAAGCPYPTSALRAHVQKSPPLAGGNARRAAALTVTPATGCGGKKRRPAVPSAPPRCRRDRGLASMSHSSDTGCPRVSGRPLLISSDRR
jgi:hypothetical protein